MSHFISLVQGLVVVIITAVRGRAARKEGCSVMVLRWAPWAN
jgi:hypothetical protein